VNVTFRMPWNEEGVSIDTMSTLGNEVAVNGKLPMRTKPGVFVDALDTVHGRLPLGPGKPQEMVGIPPPGIFIWTVPESSPFNPQALSGEVTLRPVMSTDGPVDPCIEVFVATAATMTMITKTRITAAMTPGGPYLRSGTSTRSITT
jgi:hypothetical protein